MTTFITRLETSGDGVRVGSEGSEELLCATGLVLEAAAATAR